MTDVGTTTTTSAADLKKWPYQLRTYSPDEVRRYCVNDAGWQKFRLSMKGVPTTKKLEMLQGWYLSGNVDDRRTQVQVDNYINALKRGGQLNMQLEVQR